MKPAVRTLAFILQFATIGLAMAFVITQLWPRTAAHMRQSAPPIVTTAPEISRTSAETAKPGASRETPANATPSAQPSGPFSYADAVTRAAPAVVNIYTQKIITGRLSTPNQQIIDRLLGTRTGTTFRARRPSLGSGVIISADGYVLTNNHVISGADEIQMQLYDGRIAQAKVVGTDADTDLAVLKIDASNLPTMAMHEKSAVKVGDVVLAIGNPFGFGKTVTMGIVSATGRQQASLSEYEDFIQTDAAINDGNSGGALINAAGELVGINTATVHRSAGAEGIGFAIPMATAKNVLDQIIDHGIVVRGWLGIECIDLPIAANSGLPGATRGVLVQGVYADSPSALAGMQGGDILLKINDEDIFDRSQLLAREAAITPGTKVRLSGMRQGESFSTEVTVIQRPSYSTDQIRG